jgi:eukaryotic-like serine/threonine-protein kinase
MHAALAVVPDVKDELVLARALTNLSIFLSTTGDLSRAAQLLDQTLAITLRLGDSAGETIVLDNLGYYYVVVGLPEQGREALQRALSVAQKIGFNKSVVYSQLNLGLAYVRLGDSLAASQVLEQALSVAAGVDHFAAAVGYSYLGLAAEAAGDPAPASRHFAEAWRRLEVLGMLGNGQDALAGLARGALSVGETGQALEFAGGVWDYLIKNGSQALEFPILAYQTCAQVFTAAGDHARGEEAIRRGYQELLERAAKVSDPAWRRAFLENIPEHRMIARLGARLINP